MSQTHDETTADSTEPVLEATTDSTEPVIATFSESSRDSLEGSAQPVDRAADGLGAEHAHSHDADAEGHHGHHHDQDDQDDQDDHDVQGAADDAAAGPGTLAAASEASEGASFDAPDDEAAELSTDEQDDLDGSEALGSSRRSRRAPSRELLEKEGEIAADFLETLLDICDLDGDLDVDIDGDRAAVSIVDSEEGRVPRRLVGTDGKVLDALQELTRLAVYSSTGERSRLILDIAGHRAERRTTLVAQAQAAIAAVRETGQKQALDPMSAFERKIVHDEVLAGGLHSESDGVEPRRYVVVLPA